MVQMTPMFQGPLPDNAVFAIRNIAILQHSNCSDITLGRVSLFIAFQCFIHSEKLIGWMYFNLVLNTVDSRCLEFHGTF